MSRRIEEKLATAAPTSAPSAPARRAGPLSRGGILALQRSAGNAAVARMLAVRGTAQPQRGRVLARLVDGLDYRALARRIRAAVHDLFTDEEAIYGALQQLDRDKGSIAVLRSTYRALYDEELDDALRGDLSGAELEYAMQLLGERLEWCDWSEQRIDAAPRSPADFDEAAERIRKAVDSGFTDEEAIFATLLPLNRDPDLIDTLAATYRRKHSEDLVQRVRDELSGPELQYAMHLLRRGPSSGKAAVSAAAEAMVGKRMTWIPSGPRSDTMFTAWASASSEAAAPPIKTTTTMNCWEMVLLAAYRANMVSWEWIHEQYTASTGSAQGAIHRWMDHMVRVFTRGRRIPYRPGAPDGRKPVAGEIVFMDGLMHICLATGRTDSRGRAQVISFWPPPQEPGPMGGLLEDVKHTTIEELVDYWTVRTPPAPSVELAAPPWA